MGRRDEILMRGGRGGGGGFETCDAEGMQEGKGGH